MGEKLMWEYLVFYSDPDPRYAEATLNRLGAEGWELVVVTAQMHRVSYLKRPAGRQALDQNGGEHGG